MASATLPQPQVTESGDGIKTIVSYKLNEAGRKVKVTRKVRESLVPATEAAVASRRQWARYGLEKGSNPENYKPDFGEEVTLRLQAKNQKPSSKEAQAQDQQPVKKQAVMTNIRCRHCKGSHFTHDCPYKDRIGGLKPDEAEIPGVPGITPVPGIGAAATGTPGKYQPPSLRGAPGIPMAGLGGRMEDRDESTTLKVSNIPENIADQALRDYFGRAGRVTRCHVARDRETGLGRGFAFVSFETVPAAEKAQRAFDGQPVGHLIMRVEFSKKNPPPRRF